MFLPDELRSAVSVAARALRSLRVSRRRIGFSAHGFELLIDFGKLRAQIRGFFGKASDFGERLFANFG